MDIRLSEMRVLVIGPIFGLGLIIVIKRRLCICRLVVYNGLYLIKIAVHLSVASVTQDMLQ